MSSFVKGSGQPGTKCFHCICQCRSPYGSSLWSDHFSSDSFCRVGGRVLPHNCSVLFQGLTECFFCHFVFRIGGLCFAYIECNQKLSQSDLKLPVAATGDLLWQNHLQGAWRGQALCFHSSSMQWQEGYTPLFLCYKEASQYMFMQEFANFPKVCLWSSMRRQANNPMFPGLQQHRPNELLFFYLMQLCASDMQCDPDSWIALFHKYRQGSHSS